jgi:ABC-type multidrug transport system fused ATPase/permease subunit
MNKMNLRDVFFVSSRIFKKVSLKRQKQFLWLMLLTIIGSISEVISLGAIVPFLGALTQPNVVLEYPIVRILLESVNLNNNKQDLILFMTITFSVAAIFAGIMRLMLLRVGIYLSNTAAADISENIYNRTLYQPYSVHISRSSSEIITGITQKVSTVVRVMMSVVTVITSAGLFTAILSGLIFINPRIAIISAFFFGLAYIAIAWFVQQRLLSNGKKIAYESTGVVKSLQEGLGAIREVLLDGTQKVHAKTYNNSIQTLQKANAESTFLNQAPRYLMETIGIVFIATLAFFLSRDEGGIAAAIPLLGVLAFGAQRLIPIMQQLYGNWTSFATNYASLLDVLELIEQPLPKYAYEKNLNKLTFNKSITLKNIFFHHHPESPWVLKNINLSIMKGSCVGIIGSTGGGKSTLLDVLMSLLEPSKGSLLLDGKKLDSTLAYKWQRSIAHVPQSIFLTDSSIMENIAFGIEKEKIDIQRVRIVAKYAQINHFIESQQFGYNSMVGERGVRLSGGQKQRIGIARALYKGAKVLILDEATSALDSSTEEAVMKEITSLSEDLTVLIIAHRITTLKNCNTVIKLEKGEIVEQNSYDYFIGQT